MRTYTFLQGLTLTLALTGCSDLLEPEPAQYISDQSVIVDKKSAEAALLGAYDALQGYATAALVAHELAADNVVNYNNQNNVIPDLTPSTSNGGFTDIYSAINQANFVIQQVPLVNDNFFTQADKDKLVGEAHFLRALFYFDLARSYGGAQLVLTPSASAEAHVGVKRSSLEDTYAQVLDDLNTAESLLLETIDRNRANRYTVYALKARLYLYTEQWEQAEEYASRVLAHASFTLVKPYARFFTEINTTESVFELVYTTTDDSNFWTTWLSPADGGRHDYIPAREFVPLLLDPAVGGTRKSLIKQTAEGTWDLIQYGKQNGTSSLFILRIAEQYLIRAEARARKTASDIEGAVNDLNAVKERAEVPLVVYDASLTETEVTRLILDERRLELPFEGHRFRDVIRTGYAAEIFGAYNANLKDPGRWVLPIPLSAILRDDDLEQNDAYK